MSGSLQQRRIRRTFAPVVVPGDPPPPDPVPGIPFRTPRGSALSVRKAYGINVHMTYGGSPYRDQRPLTYQRLRESGAGWVREGIVAPKDANQRAAMAQISAVDGMDISFIVGRSENASSAEAGTNAALDEIAWYAASPGTRGRVVHIEAWNEPNNFGGANWAANSVVQQKRLYPAAKARPAIAGIPVTSPSLAWNGTAAPYDDMGDLSPWADWGNVHYYTGGNMPEFGFGDGPHNIATLGAMATGSKPQILTEAGGHHLQEAKSFRRNADGTTTILGNDTHLWTPPEVMGIYGPRYLFGPMWGGITKTALYELWDRTNSDRTINKERNFGLLRTDGTPWPVFHAMARTMEAFKDTSHPTLVPVQIDWKVAGATPPADFRPMLFQRSDGSYLLVMWRAKSVWKTAYAAPYPTNLIAVPTINVTITLGRSSNVTFTRPSDPGNAAAPVNGVTSFTVPVGADVQIARIAAV